ncbi:dihydrolipoamide acetyltransferase family protein [Pseudonocardia xishanensis]|uniref:Dihydrolipoamide acetyltransferase component of pyruvate dehydrogenase complex n=1 Tax=Pseudonocardia xishanensis TaxID=630995 RepID=A0ABP8RL33_9PSEU
MSELFALPDVGEGLTEAEIVAWQVAPGDTVTVNQILLEIETAKAVVELPSPYAGTVGSLLVEPGETVAVGTPIISIETGTSAPAAEPTPAAPAAPAAPTEDGGAKIGEAGADGRIATLVGYLAAPGAATRRPRHGRGGGAPAAQSAAPTTAAARPAAAAPAGAQAAVQASAEVAPVEAPRPGPAAGGSLVPLAKPPVRKLAKDLGVDLRAVTGSGPGGVITREDVHTAAATPAAPPAAPPAALPEESLPEAPPVEVPRTATGVGGERREQIRGVRKATAAAMVQSAFTAPHVTEFLTVDVTETMALRDRLKGSRAYADVKLTPLAFVAKAVCLAARRTPAVNASWDEPAGEIVYYDRVQLGIAAATPRGLLVPKIRDADTLDLRGLAAALATLTETARAGKTSPADLAGGTITITNVGVFGVDTGTPILNPGEAAILAVGSIKQAPWVVDGELAVRTVCRLALSFDHRLVDGEQGSRFLADIGALLEDPATAMLW